MVLHRVTRHTRAGNQIKTHLKLIITKKVPKQARSVMTYKSAGGFVQTMLMRMSKPWTVCSRPHMSGVGKYHQYKPSSILYECVGRVARITLNRPARFNAIDHHMPAELANAVRIQFGMRCIISMGLTQLGRRVGICAIAYKSRRTGQWRQAYSSHSCHWQWKGLLFGIWPEVVCRGKKRFA
jgi:hypothetical protein